MSATTSNEPRSRTSSTVTPPFPVPVKPNPHPYAIKTTSTGLLSRTSSSPHHSSTYQHYVPLPSPSSAGSTSESPTKRASGHAAQGQVHRYSRSMTDAPPRSLPLPPPIGSRPSSVSPKKMQFMELEPDLDYTPMRRRAESASGDGLFRDMALPEDPKTWDATQLAAYLSTKIVGDSVREIANFVRERRIDGQTFLRLRERDLEGLGVDLEWASTLLDASRSLRQSTLRGHIWGFGGTPDSAYNPPTRSRSDSLSSDDGGEGDLQSNNGRNGRVKGMVASFEQSSSSSGSEQEDHNGDQLRSASPTKASRGLPPRPRVVDLFSRPVSISPTAAAEYDDGLTLKGVPNRNKELPRLLPFPPPPPSLTPAHTGAGYVLPASPDHELGYRRSVRPQSTGQKARRLLPIPPVLIPSPDPAAHMHHPRPVRGGNGPLPELVQQVRGDEPSVEELLATRSEGPQQAPPAPISGVEAWEMELGDTVRRVGGKLEEEDGDKTVDGVPVSPGSFVIGRTGKRGRVRPKSKASTEELNGEAAVVGKRRSSGGLSSSMAELFVPLVKTSKDVGSQTDGEGGETEAPVSRGLELDKGFAELDRQRVELVDLGSRVAVRESEVGRRERDVGLREKAVETKESQVESRVAAAVAEREDQLRKQLDEVSGTKKELEARDIAILAKEKNVEEREKEVEARVGAVRKKEEGLVAETTLSLAARLVRRVVGNVVGPVLGDGVVNLILKPLGGQQESAATAKPVPTAPSRPTLFSLARRGPYAVLLGLGMCAALLRVLMKRVLMLGAVRIGGRVGASR